MVVATWSTDSQVLAAHGSLATTRALALQADQLAAGACLLVAPASAMADLQTHLVRKERGERGKKEKKKCSLPSS